MGDGPGVPRAGLPGLPGVPGRVPGLLRWRSWPRAVAGATVTIISRPLPVRAQERRNAENPAETVPGLGPGAAAPAHRGRPGRCRGQGSSPGVSGAAAGAPVGGRGVLRQRFRQTGRPVGGTGPRRQCGPLGKIAKCQAGAFPAPWGTGGRVLGDQRWRELQAPWRELATPPFRARRCRRAGAVGASPGPRG